MTLFTSVDFADSSCNSLNAKRGLIYLAASLVCAVFGAIYEAFGHGVYSYCMIYAFMFPLAGGALPFYIMAFAGKKSPPRFAVNLYGAGIATLTVGSLLKGVLELYGTTNSLVNVYRVAGTVLVAAGAVLFAIRRCTGKP